MLLGHTLAHTTVYVLAFPLETNCVCYCIIRLVAVESARISTVKVDARLMWLEDSVVIMVDCDSVVVMVDCDSMVVMVGSVETGRLKSSAKDHSQTPKHHTLTM